jgi:hypothetical protein
VETLTLNNIGLKGLATDPRPWTLPPEFITFGINFRIYAGAIIAKSGYNLWSTAPVNFNPAFPFHVGATNGDYWLICGRSAVYAFDGENWDDVSSLEGYGTLNVDDELRWSACMIGQIPAVNNPQSWPEFWSPQDVGQILQPLPFDTAGDITFKDQGISGDILRSHRNFMFLLSTHESGIDFPDTYRWSHPADINGLPPTWDETNDAFLAGKAALGGDGGRIIDGRSLRDAFAIYSDNSVDILDYTNDEFVWRRRELSATVGLLSRQALVEVKGVHYFLGDGDVLRNDGNKIESIAQNRIRGQITNRISVENYDRCYAVRNDPLKEIWFCIPEAGEDYPNIAYIYNWSDSSWTVKDLPDNIGVSNFGSQSVAADQWDEQGNQETWDTQIRPWGSARRSPLDDTVVGANPVTGTVYLLDPAGAPDEDYATRVERTDFPLLNDVVVTTITRVYPHVDGDGKLRIQFGSQDFPGAPVRWKPAVDFDPTTDRKIDLRTTGELHAWRFQSIEKTPWALSGFTIEYEMAGKR